MSLLTTVKTILGSAWHVASDAALAAMLPETDGTVEAGKPVVPDANKDVSSLRNLTLTGTLAQSTSKQFMVPAAGRAKLGGSGAGWAVDADNALPFVTLPASQTSEVLLIPIEGLQVGDIVTAVGVCGQVESAGGTVTIALDVRKVTAAAGDFTDASLGTDDLGSGVTADTILSGSNLGVTGLTETMAADELLYATITATTAGSTDIVIAGLMVTVTRK